MAVTLTLTVSNTDAQRFYRALGYVLHPVDPPKGNPYAADPDANATPAEAKAWVANQLRFLVLQSEAKEIAARDATPADVVVS